MKVASLYALWHALRDYLAEKLSGTEVLAAAPTVRHPLCSDQPVLVIGVQSLRHAEQFLDPSDGILLEIGLTLTVCSRDSSEECEQIAGNLAELATGGDFPFQLLSLQSRAVEFDRTIGAFLAKTECSICCLLSESEEAAP